MKFTPKNLTTEVPKIKNLAPELKTRWEKMMKPNIKSYDTSDTIRRGIDIFVKQINDRYGSKEQPKQQPKAKAQPKSKPSQKAVKKTALKANTPGAKQNTKHTKFLVGKTYIAETNHEEQEDGQTEPDYYLITINEISKDRKKIKYSVSCVFEDADSVEFDGQQQDIGDFTEDLFTEKHGNQIIEEFIDYDGSNYNIRADYEIEPSYKDFKAKAKAPAKAKATPKAAKKIAPTYTGNYVEQIPVEVGFIKRYAALHGKYYTSETKKKALTLLDSMQKAIVELKIRKTSKYATEINDIQKSLISLLSDRVNGAIISITNVDKYTDIGKNYKVSDSVSVIKQFLAIQGKEGVKEKAKNLHDKVNNLLSNNNISHSKELIAIHNSLVLYSNGKTTTPEISSQFLAGLYGLAGIETPTPKSGHSVSAAQFVGSTFSTLLFTGKWKNLIGLPSEHFKLMIYGKAGSGKSTFSLKLADYLAQLGKSVLYVAGEEKFGYTLHEKIVRLNISSPNLYLNDKLPTDLSKYDVVFIDSVNTLSLTPEDLEKLPKSKAYVWIFQCTKEGNYRGSQEFEHNADSVIEINDMKATVHKNRFGGSAKELVF